MQPVRLEGSEGSGWYLVHRCVACGHVRRAQTAQDDPVQPDRWDRIVELSCGG